METAATRAIADDISRDAVILKAKKRIYEILKALPDDDARRRVLGSAAVLVGAADAVMKTGEQP